MLHHDGKARPTRCEAIEAFRKKLDTAAAGDNVGLLLEKVGGKDVGRGDRITAP